MRGFRFRRFWPRSSTNVRMLGLGEVWPGVGMVLTSTGVEGDGVVQLESSTPDSKPITTTFACCGRLKPITPTMPHPAGL